MPLDCWSAAPHPRATHAGGTAGDAGSPRHGEQHVAALLTRHDVRAKYAQPPSHVRQASSQHRAATRAHRHLPAPHALVSQLGAHSATSARVFHCAPCCAPCRPSSPLLQMDRASRSLSGFRLRMVCAWCAMSSQPRLHAKRVPRRCCFGAGQARAPRLDGEPVMRSSYLTVLARRWTSRAPRLDGGTGRLSRSTALRSSKGGWVPRRSWRACWLPAMRGGRSLPAAAAVTLATRERQERSRVWWNRRQSLVPVARRRSRAAT